MLPGNTSTETRSARRRNWRTKLKIIEDQKVTLEHFHPL